MAPGGQRPAKRVKAVPQTEQPTRVSVRLKKTRQSATTPPDEDRTQEQLDSGPNAEVRTECREEVRTASPVRDWSYEGQSHQPTCDIGVEPSPTHDAQQVGDGVDNSEEHTQLGDEEDTPSNAKKGGRPHTMGKLLHRMTRAMGRRLPVTVGVGKRRPEKPVQAAKLASKGGIAIRRSVPILTHWKEYKKQDNTVLDNFMGTLAGRLAMDTNDNATKVACVDVLQCGVRQARYRLKKQYFDGVPANEVRTTSPVSNITDVEWRKLVQKWSDPKNKEISKKKKQNRAKVKFH